jgi:flagellar motor switch protein FliN/FliY
MATQQEIDNFFGQWIEEFSRAVEMFTGDKPLLTYSRLEGIARQEAEKSQLVARFWWKQPVEGGVEGASSFASWVGAQHDCWKVVASAVDEADPRRAYLELLEQANKGTVAVLSAGFSRPLRCADGLEEPLRSLATLEVAEIKVVFREQELPPILLAIEPGAARVLQLAEMADAPHPAANRPVPGSTDKAAHLPGYLASYAAGHLPDQSLQSPMMNRLMELRLPVSVLLGHTSISIREVLKLTPGSVIELDRKVGDYVEIVVHGTVVARGEIVSVGGNYGVRIKEVISREDRLALRHAA